MWKYFFKEVLLACFSFLFFLILYDGCLSIKTTTLENALGWDWIAFSLDFFNKSLYKLLGYSAYYFCLDELLQTAALVSTCPSMYLFILWI